MLTELLYLKWNPNDLNKEPRVEIFNYKNTENFQKFVNLTEANEDLEKCVDEDLETSSTSWLKIVKKIIKTSFTKIRIKKKNLKPELELLFQ